MNFKHALCIAASILMMSGCNDSKKTLHVYNWADYIDPELICAFEQQNNCNVVIDTFESNEAAYAKLKAGAFGYDICFPSSYQVAQMKKEGMIQKLDMSKLPNVMSNFDHSFDNQILDPSMEYSVPFAATYTGFMCVADKVQGEVASLDILANQQFKGKITFLDDMREVIGLGLMYNGYSLNSTDQQEIDKAVETVLKWRGNVRKFDAESYKSEVANKSIWIGHGYSSDALQVIVGEDGEVRNDIKFVLPKEGFTIAWDEMVVMANAKEKDLAYKFIDMLYDGDCAFQNITYINSVMANKVGLSKLDKKLKDIIMLSNEDAKRGQVLKGFESAPHVQEMYNKAWDKIRAIKK